MTDIKLYECKKQGKSGRRKRDFRRRTVVCIQLYTTKIKILFHHNGRSEVGRPTDQQEQ
jgi:hypothetical protein